MPKKNHDYKTDDVVRRGEEISSHRRADDMGRYGIWARKFDPARGEMGGWTLVSEIMEDPAKAQEAWKYYADHLRSEGALSAVLVQVHSHWLVDEQYKTIGKYNTDAIAVDVRSSSLLAGDGGVTRLTAPGAFDLHLAINRDFGEWLDSQSNLTDEQARDIGHNTSNGTTDPTPELIDDHMFGNVPAVPIGDTGSAYEAQQNATATETQTGETVEYGASGKRKHKRKE